HPHLAARLDREDLLHALVGARDVLELTEPLDVGLEGFAARAGTGTGDRIGGLDDHADGRFVRHVVMVRRDAVDHHRMLAVLGRHLDAELHVRAFVVVRHDLADVMQERAPLGERHVELQLGRHHPGEPRDFLGVLEDVLPVGGPVLHPAHELDQLGVEAVDPGVVRRLLPRLDDAGVDLFPGFVDDLLDAPRVDPAVGDEALQGQASHFAADGVEAGNHDGVGRVVDDDVDAGGGFEGADVPALAADDTAFHFIRGQGDRRDGRLRRLLGGDPLDRDRDDLPRFAVGVLLRLFLDVPDQGGRVTARFVLEGADQLLLGVSRGESRNPLEPGAALGFQPREAFLPLLQRLFHPPDVALAVLDFRDFAVERLLAPFHFLPAAHQLPLEPFARPEQLLFYFERPRLFSLVELSRMLTLGVEGREGGDPAFETAPDDVKSRARGHRTAEHGYKKAHPAGHLIYLQQRRSGGAP